MQPSRCGHYTAARYRKAFCFFKPHLPSLIYYGSFFILGYLFHYYQEVLQASVRCQPWCGLAALLLFPLSLTMSHLDHQAESAAFDVHLAAVVTHGLCTWVLIYAFVGVAMRYFDRPSPWSL